MSQKNAALKCFLFRFVTVARQKKAFKNMMKKKIIITHLYNHKKHLY